MKIKNKIDDEIAVDMSPMIDLVFLLLIFFLVASTIVKVDKAIIEIPDAVYAVVPEDTTGRYEITITKDDELYVGPQQIEMKQINDDSLAELKNLVEKEVALNNKLKVVVRADGRVKYKTTEKIMNACGEAGAEDMIFSAFEQSTVN